MSDNYQTIRRETSNSRGTNDTSVPMTYWAIAVGSLAGLALLSVLFRGHLQY